MHKLLCSKLLVVLIHYTIFSLNVKMCQILIIGYIEIYTARTGKFLVVFVMQLFCYADFRVSSILANRLPFFVF